MESNRKKAIKVAMRARRKYREKNNLDRGGCGFVGEAVAHRFGWPLIDGKVRMGYKELEHLWNETPDGTIFDGTEILGSFFIPKDDERYNNYRENSRWVPENLSEENSKRGAKS